uniref:Uncharacterized protein n=1 Tax=Tanacetum cinerariifolium TaxID=118510 RepID=A0A699HSK1_TANCI|nr:hypothetical protein [Tanacetum cinerariifolium]
MITWIASLAIRGYPYMCFHCIGFRAKIIPRVCFLGSFATFSSQWGSSKLPAWLKDEEQGYVSMWGGLGMDIVRMGTGSIDQELHDPMSYQLRDWLLLDCLRKMPIDSAFDVDFQSCV